MSEFYSCTSCSKFKPVTIRHTEYKSAL